MHIYLRDLNAALCDLWGEAFKDVANVTTQHGDIFQSPVECCVSPANSFGWMDGGIDAHYVRTMGQQVERRVQEEIRHLPFKELLVGQSVCVETGYRDCPSLIAAPTMRHPGPTTAEAVFRSTRAALSKAKRRLFTTVAMPGMGTLTGRVPLPHAVDAMRAAYNAVYA
jgi:O-acetyl-ADP-ribose deacetylase (regulator of RNase III)